MSNVTINEAPGVLLYCYVCGNTITPGSLPATADCPQCETIKVGAMAPVSSGTPVERTFIVELEIHRGGGTFEASNRPIVFTAPQTEMPTCTLEAIARCRVEAELYKAPEFKDKGKNWKVKTVREQYDFH